MKTVKLILLTLSLSLFNIIVLAQSDPEQYRRDAYKCINNGDCVRAEQNYEMYKVLSDKTDKNLEQQIQECKRPKRMNFVTFNAAYSVAPQWSLGGCYGRMGKGRLGWFLGVMTNLGFKGFSADKECDAEGYLIDGSRPNYSEKMYRDRLSVIGGGMLRITDPLFFKLGIGYGIRNLCWEGGDGTCYRNLGYSTEGIDVSAGLQLHLNRFVISGDIVTTNFKTVEGKVGIGVTF